MELVCKWGSWEMKLCPYWMLVPQGWWTTVPSPCFTVLHTTCILFFKVFFKTFFFLLEYFCDIEMDNFFWSVFLLNILFLEQLILTFLCIVVISLVHHIHWNFLKNFLYHAPRKRFHFSSSPKDTGCSTFLFYD